MEGKLETIKHTKRIIDSQFSTLINEYQDFNEMDVVLEVMSMANVLFTMAESFGYGEIIEEFINQKDSNQDE